MSGAKYLGELNTGKTMEEIAYSHGVTKGIVAGHIYRFRKKHGLQTKRARGINTVRKRQDEEKEKRLKALSECEKINGITICPARYSAGFGFKRTVL